jgi:hypothetical protein
MLRRKSSGTLSAILTGVIVFPTPSPSATVPAAWTGDCGWANTLQISIFCRHMQTPRAKTRHETGTFTYRFLFKNKEETPLTRPTTGH